MTEVTPALIPGAIYIHNHSLFIALTETRYVAPLLPPEKALTITDLNPLVLHETPDSPEWVERMLRVRNTLAGDFADLHRQHQEQSTYLENLGEAIRDKAIEKNWCEEYDSFADEWGLPKRTSPFVVTVTVTVEAANADEARAMVEEDVHMTSYTDGVVIGPEYDVCEVD